MSDRILFGGMPVFAPQDPTLPDQILGDTWEHVDLPSPLSFWFSHPRLHSMEPAKCPNGRPGIFEKTLIERA